MRAVALIFDVVSDFEERTTMHGGNEEEGRNEDKNRFHGGVVVYAASVVYRSECGWVECSSSFLSGLPFILRSSGEFFIFILANRECKQECKSCIPQLVTRSRTPSLKPEYVNRW